MSTYKINLKEQTATSINGITFKLTETKSGEYEGVCLNPKDVPPDDLDDVILGRLGDVFNILPLAPAIDRRRHDYRTKKGLRTYYVKSVT